MKTQLKRTLFVLLTIVMLITVTVFAASAADTVASGTCGDNLTWELDSDGLLKIEGMGEMTSSPWRDSYSENIKSVDIGEGVTSIGGWAFYGCSSLASIDIPAGVTSIGYHAFYGCSGLASIDIPAGVTSIGSSAFSGCSSLASVTFAENSQLTSIDWRAFYDCSSLASITIPDSVTNIGYEAFRNCSSLASIKVGKNVENINYGMFANAAFFNDSSNYEDGVLYIGNHLIKAESSISGEYTVKDGTLNIGDSAFEYCSNLISVTIPDSVTSIGYNAFFSCGNLTSITIPDSVTSIGADAFRYCSSLASITVDANNANYCAVDNVLFNKDKTTLIFFPDKKAESYSIPDSVTKIASDAFWDRNITSVSIPASVIDVNSETFSGCDSLTNITVDANNTNYCAIDNVIFNKDKTTLIFYPHKKTGSYSIPDGVTKIEYEAFNYRDITSVNIPDSLVEINNNSETFSYCK